jgi:hypothetical protein
MNIDLNDAIVRLNPDNNFKMHDARGACIHVHFGDLWITQEGDQKDHIVKTGESFAISNSGTTFLTAMNDAGVSVMKKCSELAIAATANIGTVVPSLMPKPAETSAGQNHYAVSDSGFDVSQIGDRQPGAEDIEHNLVRAERSRARFFGHAMRRGWNAMRRSIGVVREFG